MDNQTITTHPTLENFPSLPQVLIRLLEAIGQGTADFSHLSSIIHQDPASAARLIRIANGSLYRRHSSCRSVEEALGLLGIETVKTLIITTSIRQYFNQFSFQHHDFLQQFWHRSMVTAHSARVLASLTRYPSITEAYLCGLLCDAGQLYLLSGHADTYTSVWKQADGNDQALLTAERKALGADHCEVGAALLEQWQLGSFMADAVRYHHQPAPAIASSHQLVKLLNMASALSSPGPLSESTLASARQLFGLNEELLHELFQRICREVRDTSGELGIDRESTEGMEPGHQAHRQLGQVIEQVSRRQAMQGVLSTREQQSPLALRVSRALFLGLGVERYILFLYDQGDSVLKGFTQPGTTTADFVVEPSGAQGLVARSFREQAPIVSTEQEPGMPGTITDQQLMRYCHRGQLLCLPFNTGGQSGVLVTGLEESSPEKPASRPLLWRSLVADIVPLFNVDTVNENGATQSGVSDRRIRETLHEISNPLTIIRNYLEMLRMRLDEQAGAGQEIDILKQEMERISEILVRLRDPDAPVPERIIDLNDLVGDHARLLEQSLCMGRQIQVITRLDEKMPPLSVDPVALKQVITNLTKNAVEAMGKGGVLRLTSRARVMMNGRQHTALDIEDNGPGLPGVIMDRMLHDETGQEDDLHSGLGLSIANQLMESMGGQILCSTDDNGTAFTLLFPTSRTTVRTTS